MKTNRQTYPLNRLCSLLLCGCLCLSTSCQPTPESAVEKQLDHFGEFDNTEVSFQFKGTTDSIHFNMNFYQHLSGGHDFDTILPPTLQRTSITKTITLEKPTMLIVTVNGNRDNVFLLPGEQQVVKYDLTSDQPVASFEDDELHRINTYFDGKAALLGGLHPREVYGPILLKSVESEQEIIDTMNLIKASLLDHLEAATGDSALPAWFVAYEKRNIATRDHLHQVSISLIRRSFRMSDWNPETLRAISGEVDLNDEANVVTQDFVTSLYPVIRDTIDPLKFLNLEPVEKFSLYHKWGQRIENDRIRDVFYSAKFYDMKRFSTHFPDTLFEKYRSSIGVQMHPYLDRIEKEFDAMTGKPAPPIHLKDPEGQLVSLPDLRGNVLLLDFWFIGCPGCKKELPYDRKLLASFRDKPFRLVKICMKSDPDDWLAMQDQLTGINLISNPVWDKKLTQSYQLGGYPRYVLVDETGKILEGWCEQPSDPALHERLVAYFAKGSPTPQQK